MKKIILLSLLCASFLSHGQQDPLYAQYFNNPILINPAYTGSHNNWQTIAGHRSQWGGFDGSPTTQHLTSHTSLMQNKVGLGLVIIQDKIGESKNTEVSFNYSYRIEQDDRSFQFGLSTGFTQYQVDASMIKLQHADDPNFVSVNETKFNTGVGVLMKSERYIVGLSIPRLLPATVKSGTGSAEIYKQHYYLYGAYMILLNETMRFRPATLIKATQGAPLSVDLNANIEINDTYTAGLLTRNFNTYGLLLRATIKKYRLGYVFEVPTDKSVGQVFTSHEITLGVALTVFGSHSDAFSNF